MDVQVIQNKIYEIRGRRVMLDFDLAALYGIPTKALKQAVRRNFERFEGEDFMFELTEIEYNRLNVNLRSQIVTLETVVDGRGLYPKYPPFAFTEVGVSMLSSVLRSPAAIYTNRAIMRAFVAMRDYTGYFSRTGRDPRDHRTAQEYAREEIDNLYSAFAALSAKTPKLEKSRQPIGYPTTHNT